MELREIYETLLRRGMPEHPRLRSSDRWSWILKGDGGQAVQRSLPVDEDDTRDLITMHALRWVNSFPLSMKLKCAHYCLGAATESLEDILLTTIPLEPKKTLA